MVPQKQLGSRLRSPLLRRGTMPAQPFSRFFHHTAFAWRGESTQWTGEYVWAQWVTQPPRRANGEWR